MAAYTPAGVSTHPTLTPSTVDTVTFTVDAQAVEVLNRDAAGTIYFTTDGSTPAVPTTPPVGDGSYVVPAGQALIVNPPGAAGTVVKLVSSAACAYSVVVVG